MRCCSLFLGLIFAFISALLLPSVVLAEISYIGPGLKIQDNNTNVLILRDGGTDRILHFGFRVPKSGYITSFKTYFQQNPGYSAGTGGLIRVRLWPADESSPARPNRTGQPISEGTYQMNFVDGRAPNDTDKFPLITLIANSPVTAGNLYFFEIKNIDPQPTINYTSANVGGALSEHITDVRHWPQSDWVLVYEYANVGGGSTWYDESLNHNGPLYDGLFHFPHLDFGYSDGTKYGHFRYEPSNYSGYEYVLNNSSSITPKLRERINIENTMKTVGWAEITTPYTIVGAEIHGCASVAGNLQVRFILNDIVKASKTIIQGSANCGTSGPNNNRVFTWYTIDLASNEYFSVSNRDVLDIEMQAVGSAEWRTGAARSGWGNSPDFGWSKLSTDAYGSAQAYCSGEWRNTLYYNKCGTGLPFGLSAARVILKVIETSSPTPTPPVSPTPTPSPSSCPADVNNDNTANVADIIQVLQTWGNCSSCKEDIDANGIVNVADIVAVLQAWGNCP